MTSTIHKYPSSTLLPVEAVDTKTDMKEHQLQEKVQSLVRTKSRQELVELCKEQKITVSGTKQELARRFLKQTEFASLGSLQRPLSPIYPHVFCLQLVSEHPPFMAWWKSFQQTNECISNFSFVRTFDHDHDAWDPLTGFVFSAKTRRVFARWNGHSLQPLTWQDLSLCREYKLPYEWSEDIELNPPLSTENEKEDEFQKERRQKILSFLKGLNQHQETMDEEEEEEEECLFQDENEVSI